MNSICGLEFLKDVSEDDMLKGHIIETCRRMDKDDIYDWIYNNEIELKNLKKEKQSLIKYLEDFISKEDYEVNIKGNYLYIAWCNAYKSLLDKIKEGNYE